MRVPGMLLIVVVLVSCLDARAQSAENVLVVLNAGSPASTEIGTYYVQKRSIPTENVLRVQTAVSETIERSDFERQIEAPIANWLTRNFAQDRILYIVLTKGIPLRVNGSSGQDGTIASVDSELTLLYRKMTGQPVAQPGRVNNPYFLGNTDVTRKTQFTHENYDIYLVSRLDGYTVADVRALIDKGIAPVREGAIILDDKSSTLESANEWLKSAAEILRTSAPQNKVLYDATAAVTKDVKNVLGYYSWGSNDPAIHERRFNLEFSKGALAAMFVSTDGRTLNEPPSDWKIGTWDDATTYFAGSPQSLIGDLIRAGVSGVAGHVAEPYLDATIRPNILFPSYLAGANLIESFFLAMPYLSWQTIVIGDPLCAPFRTTPLKPELISKGIDPLTELPGYFSAWRLKTLSSPAFNPDGVAADTIKLLMRADARAAKQDAAVTRQALEEATARDSRLGPAQLSLAFIYEQTQEYDKALERYRRVLELAPNDPIALNNLAFILAVRKNNPQEALPLAEKAYTQANGNASIADTLAWVVHLRGDDRRAKGLLAEAVQRTSQDGGIRLHFAIVLAALGENQSAREELSRALELDPKLASTIDVEQLRAKLK
jgi:uncharacterized protein (TIGR03790 family)